MFRKIALVTTLLLTLGLVGCYDTDNDQFVSQDRQEMSSTGLTNPMPAGKAMLAKDAAVDASPQGEQQRKIAESQQWVFEVKSDVLESVWVSHRDICLALDEHCEIVQATISSRGQEGAAQYGNIEMRVDHSTFEQFLTSIHEAGPAPVETSITREDKTLQWVDLHSRLENAENLRDRLQTMVKEADQGHKLSDLLAIERELNRVQSTIDSMQSQSRVMAQQTDKVRMTFNYRSAPQTVVRDIWDPIRHAWHNMTRTFSRSVGEVMLFVAATIPWLVVLIPGWIFGRWALRKLFARWLKRP